jgi:Herelleviridae exonuclease
MVLVEGKNLDEPNAESNMAGKSSILDAITWCFFGKTLRNLKHDSVVNRFHKRNCFVTTFFHKSDVSYRATRYRRHTKYRNRLLLWRGERPISFRKGSDKRTQAKLESILGFDFQSFTHTAIFGGPRPFALLTDAEQKKILESFLHFEKFEIALRRTKELLSETIDRRNDHERRTLQLRGDIQEIRGRLGSLTRADQVGKRESERERTKIKQRLKKLSRLFPERTLRKASEKARREVEVAGEKVEILVTSLAKAGAKKRLLRQRLESLKKTIANRKLGKIGELCPVCRRPFDLKTTVKYVGHLISERRGVRSELKQQKKRLRKLERRLLYARKVLKRVHKREADIHTRRQISESSRRELEIQLGKFSAGAPTPFAEEIRKLSLKYSKGVSKLLVKQFEQKSLDQRIKDLQFWVQGFGNQGVKALVVRESLPAMNRKLKEYTRKIFGGTVEMRFEPTKRIKSGEDRELFHLKYKSRFGSSSYIGESSGGRRRVDIAILLVFSWLSNACNLLLVDELLDGLDSSGRESILNILSSLRGTVLVITHEKEMKAKFRKVWTVVKRKGISHLEKAA